MLLKSFPGAIVRLQQLYLRFLVVSFDFCETVISCLFKMPEKSLQVKSGEKKLVVRMYKYFKVRDQCCIAGIL